MLVDFGGYTTASFVGVDDPNQNTHILRQYDLVGYARVNLDGVHELFAGGRTTYRDFNAGNAVNLGARLESANKSFGTRVLINERAAQLLGDRFLLRPVAKLRVVGKFEGIMTYEPLAEADAATGEQRALAAATRRVVEAFPAGDFAGCFEAVADYEQAHGPCKLAALYRELSEKYLATPPEGFCGVIALSEK